MWQAILESSWTAELVAARMAARCFSAVADIFPCLLLRGPGVIHAFLIVGDHKQARQIRKLRR